MMRERLIELLDNYGDDISLCDVCKRPSEDCEGCKNEQLAEFLLANGVIVTPCKVGDVVYKVWYTECHNGETFPDSYGCCGCEDECDLKKVITEVTAPSIEFIVANFMGGYKNHMYFLTREEAEKALEGGEG